MSAKLAGDLERIARRARNLAHYGAVAAEQRVDQRGLPDIRPSDDDDAGRNNRLLRFGRRSGRAERFLHSGEQIIGPAPVHRADPDHAGKPQLEEFRLQVVVLRVVELVDHKNDGARGTAQLGGKLRIKRQQSLATVDDEQHHVRTLDGLVGRSVRGLGKVRIGRCPDAAGIHDAERRPPQPAHRLHAVPRHPRLVMDDGNAPSGQPVEQGRFPDVRSADKDGCFHLVRQPVPPRPAWSCRARCSRFRSAA